MLLPLTLRNTKQSERKTFVSDMQDSYQFFKETFRNPNIPRSFAYLLLSNYYSEIPWVASLFICRKWRYISCRRALNVQQISRPRLLHLSKYLNLLLDPLRLQFSQLQVPDKRS